MKVSHSFFVTMSSLLLGVGVVVAFRPATKTSSKPDSTVSFGTSTSSLHASIMTSVEDRIDSIRGRIEGILADKLNAKADSAPAPAPAPEPSKPDVYCKHIPTAKMTNGIDPFYVQLCATISEDDYSKFSNISEFANVGKGYIPADVGLEKPAKAVLYENNSIFEQTNPPFVAVVAGKKLILAWRGSATMMDWDRDFGFYVSSSFRWKEVAKVVKVQGAYLAMLDNCMSAHEDELLKIVEENEITDIILTGHSLAGGTAQVAHLWFEGTMDSLVDPRPNAWKTLREEKGLTVHSMSFEGPMTTVFVKSDDEELNQKGIDFINRCGANMCTTTFSNDPVPRAYGHPAFVLPILENFLDQVEKKGVHWWDPMHLEEKALDGILHKVLATLSKNFKSSGSMQQLMDICAQFQHIGQIVYYESADSEPKVYTDNPNGILTGTDGLPQYRDIEYEPSDESVYHALYNDHLFIVRGPGLQLNPDES